jgi:hypothetical protein
MAEFDSGDGRWSVKPTELPTLNFHQFEPHVYRSVANEYSNYGRNTHGVEMFSHEPGTPQSRPMGNIQWNKDTGEIISIGVKSRYRVLEWLTPYSTRHTRSLESRAWQSLSTQRIEVTRVRSGLSRQVAKSLHERSTHNGIHS